MGGAGRGMLVSDRKLSGAADTYILKKPESTPADWIQSVHKRELKCSLFIMDFEE